MNDAESGGAYSPSASHTVNAEFALRPLRVITHNIWFSPHRRDERMRALCALWREREPDVLCVQECVAPTLRFILAQEWVRASYCVSAVTNKDVDP